MKICHTSDWHLDWITHGTRRLDELKKAVAIVVQDAIESEVDLFAFTGDLADPDSGTIVFEVVEIAIRAADTLRREAVSYTHL